jgi:hypothetical protein
MRDGRVRAGDGSLGLVFKNLVSDVGATIFSINKYGDPLLPTIAVWYRRRKSAA